MQLAETDPQGPVYLTGAREVLEEEAVPSPDTTAKWRPVEKLPLPATGMEQMIEAVLNARNPLLITSYLGRNTDAVGELVAFCEKLAIPVIESTPSYMNFPASHPLHLGYLPDEFVPKADVIIAIDTDAPWIETRKKPAPDCKIFYIDVDPLKEDIPLWYMPSDRFFRADSHEALKQLNAYVNRLELNSNQDRRARLKNMHDEQRREWERREKEDPNGIITPEWLTVCVRNVIDDDTIILNEAITNSLTVSRHLPRNRPGTMFANGGSSLGWSGGASLGAKLAKPDKTIVNITGDGSYLFGVPSSVYWMSRRYRLPFLTVIYNNQGWNATKQNVLRMYPDGAAKNHDRYWVNFAQPADLAKIAEAAGGAYARTVDDPGELQEALQTGMDEVKNGRSAVIDVRLPPISGQKD
jgi:acetolactate synthase-1/2/3 large subunit